jgi:hypothetical protein
MAVSCWLGIAQFVERARPVLVSLGMLRVYDGLQAGTAGDAGTENLAARDADAKDGPGRLEAGGVPVGSAQSRMFTITKTIES